MHLAGFEHTLAYYVLYTACICMCFLNMFEGSLGVKLTIYRKLQQAVRQSDGIFS